MKKPLLIIFVAGLLSAPAAHARYEPDKFKIYVKDWCDGPCIVVQGGINKGIAKAMKKTMKKHPDIKKVWLWSTGGWTASGFWLYRTIKKNGMDTYAKVCESACLTAFMGGKNRVLVTGADGLGFHQVTGDFGIDQYTLREQGKTRHLFKKAGVKKWFIKKKFQAKPSGMWYPSPDELLDAGVITRYER